MFTRNEYAWVYLYIPTIKWMFMHKSGRIYRRKCCTACILRFTKIALAYLQISYTLIDYDSVASTTGTNNMILSNRTGHPCTFSFSDTGKTLPLPRVDWPKGATSTRPSNLAAQYYKDYTAATGKTLNTSLYEVHHIRPLAYGGNNSYSNLIHLPKATHTSVTSWFAGY